MNHVFSGVPHVNKPRSKFSRNHSVKTMINTGDLVPLYCAPVYPGDTVTMDLGILCRSLTPSAPVMDNAYLELWAFFVPDRLVWNHLENFYGQNDTSAWTESEEYVEPYVNYYPGSRGQYSVTVGSLGDYLGLPVSFGTKNEPYAISELPLRAYYLIWNEFFRDQNYQAPKVFTIGDEANTAIKYGDKPCKVAKFHDYFTSVLPAPQKGAAVTVPLGDTAFVSGSLSGSLAFTSGYFNSPDLSANPSDANAMLDVVTSGTPFTPGDNIVTIVDRQSGGQESGLGLGGGTAGNDITGGIHDIKGGRLTFSDGAVQLKAKSYSGTVDLTDATAIDINTLRTAFATQRLLESFARSGSRYIEFLQACWGTDPGDTRLQRPENLGYFKVTLNMDTVVANSTGSAGDRSNVLGDMAGYSKTGTSSGFFTKSFVEHGHLFVLCAVRTNQTYSQGIPRHFLELRKLDKYYPPLAFLGEQPVYTAEINSFLSGDTNISGGVLSNEALAAFGYQEAFAYLRYEPDRLTGNLRPYLDGSLANWTYGLDLDESTETASGDFISETRDNVDRTLAYNDSFQFLLDVYFKQDWVRLMPLYSVPGLIDHY